MKKIIIAIAPVAVLLSGCFDSTTQAVSSPISLGDPSAPAASCALACNTGLLDLTKDFNVLVFQDFTAPSSDTQGRIAAGRDVNIANYSVGDGLTSDSSRPDIIAGRNLTFNGGNVPNGGLDYGNSLSMSASSSAFGAVLHATPVPFNAAQVQVQGVSDSLATLSANQTASITYTGSRAFMDLNANLSQNIYTIAAADLANVHTFTVTGGSTATVVINVTGASASLSSFAMIYQGGITRNHILFNFNQATSLTMEAIAVEGTVLAPKANVSFSTGLLTGHLVALSMSGSGQFNYDPYSGCLPVISSLNYFKDSFTDSTDGYSVGGTAYEMYGMAIKQVGDYIIVGVNTNFPLEGEMYNGGHIGWGDFLMNFAGNQSTFSGSAPSTTYGVKFVSGTGSGVSTLGLYRSVTAQADESSHSGWWGWGAYEDYVFGSGAHDPLLAGVADSYFDRNSLVPNSIASGTLVSSTEFQVLNQTELAALGMDFPTGFATSAAQLGHYTFGFSFKRTSDMVGNFTGHLAMECANDVVAFPGNLEATCH